MRAQADSSPPPSPGTNEQESEWLLCLAASQAGRRQEPIQADEPRHTWRGFLGAVVRAWASRSRWRLATGMAEDERARG